MNKEAYPIPLFLLKKRHSKWSKEEDDKLRNIVSGMTNPNWNLISKNFKNRNPRQCQERWTYYLSPDVNNGPWTPEEDKILTEKYAEFGSKWSFIAKFFKGRTNTNVKNRWLSMMRLKERLAKVNSPNESFDDFSVNTQLNDQEFDPLDTNTELQNQLICEHIPELNPFEDDLSELVFDQIW